MEQAEILKRVIGILTEAQEMRRQVAEGEDRDDEVSVVTQLLNEMMPAVILPPHATVQQTGRVVGEALGPVLQRMIGAFSLAFLALADVHDSGQTDMSSTDVLRELALRVGSGGFEDL